MELERLLELRARIWVLRVREPRIEEISFESASRFGIEPEHLVADDYGACQDFADRCRHDERLPEVIRVPSAALPGTNNLVIFGPRVLAPYDSIPIDQIDVPGSVVAEGAHPLHSLIGRVRHVGEPHPVLEAWKKGASWEFTEPPTDLLSASHYH